jgi:hypothetical protein
MLNKLAKKLVQTAAYGSLAIILLIGTVLAFLYLDPREFPEITDEQIAQVCLLDGQLNSLALNPNVDDMARFRALAAAIMAADPTFATTINALISGDPNRLSDFLFWTSTPDFQSNVEYFIAMGYLHLDNTPATPRRIAKLAEDNLERFPNGAPLCPT